MTDGFVKDTALQLCHYHPLRKKEAGMVFILFWPQQALLPPGLGKRNVDMAAGGRTLSLYTTSVQWGVNFRLALRSVSSDALYPRD